MFHAPLTALRRLAFLPLGLCAMLLGGCASGDFTLEADLPGDFQLSGDAEYLSPPGQACADASGRTASHHLFTTRGHAERPQRVSFQVPLSTRVDGCTRQLSRIQIQLDGESATHPNDVVQPDLALAILSIRDRLPASAWQPPSRGAIIFDGQCRWLLPPEGAGSAVERRLQCSASDLQGRWFDATPGGTLRRADLPGRTVRLAIGAAPDVPATVTARGQ
ncbi:hypothetical protein HNP46_003880 [Pseudomonas nitritireducens]|uniref:Lipoprotein n=1 Tax=Pseudomonas nitroreducens TaxID=46680 RepID=A0A7W7KLI9_PSENT|nr:hypothetical protein [Pseudomonas nitritireducens]MBB4865004.1 hypothetical protein [Pseudomonas nitritireducens]